MAVVSGVFSRKGVSESGRPSEAPQATVRPRGQRPYDHTDPDARRSPASATAPSRRGFRLCVLTGREPWRGGAEPDTFPAMTDPVQDALALLRSLHRDYEFWVVKKVGAKGYWWQAKRKTDGKVVSTDDPEELVEAMRQLRDL